MIRRVCQRTDLWLAALAAEELDRADAIRLQEHLQHCADCRARAKDLDWARQRLRDNPPQLAAQSRARIWADLAAGQASSATGRRSLSVVRWAFVGAAALAAALVAVVFWPRSAAVVGEAATPIVAWRVDAVRGGVIRDHAGATIARGRLLSSRDGATLVLPQGATADLSTSGRAMRVSGQAKLRFARRQLELVAGWVA
ncbi:MAG: zf-HC2 domain-containing protein, partial [Planctomycetales bacterium]|nr:zf-HC2 domain-containing protein [Planctomycetales bacterium]